MLWYSSFLPSLANDFVQWEQYGGLTVFDQVWGISSLPGALPESKLSMALLGSSTNGSESNSSMVGRHSISSRDA